MVKHLPAIPETPGFDPWVGKISWRRKWQPTPVFLLGESQGWRSLVGYSPWGCKELDMTERLHFFTSYLYNGILLSHKKKKKEIMPFAATQMQLEVIILNEVSQKEKEKYHVIPLICGI